MSTRFRETPPAPPVSWPVAILVLLLISGILPLATVQVAWWLATGQALGGA